VADDFVEALRRLEEDRDVEGLIAIYTEDCEVGNVSVSETFRGHEGLREFWTEYRKTFDEMKSTFRNVFATEEGAALERTTEGTSNGDTVFYDGVSILEIEGGKVRRFMDYFDTRDLTPKSWTDSAKLAARPNGPTYSRVLRNPCLLLNIYSRV
jgi:ketosteroid isomerase-like protein